VSGLSFSDHPADPAEYLPPEPTPREIDQANLDALVAAARAVVDGWEHNLTEPVHDLADALGAFNVTKTGKVLTESEVRRYVEEAESGHLAVPAAIRDSIAHVVAYGHGDPYNRAVLHDDMPEHLHRLHEWLRLDQTPGGMAWQNSRAHALDAEADRLNSLGGDNDPYQASPE
jgi:hypothetical protein